MISNSKEIDNQVKLMDELVMETKMVCNVKVLQMHLAITI